MAIPLSISKEKSINPCILEYMQRTPFTDFHGCININIDVSNNFDAQAVEAREEEIVSADGTSPTEWKILSREFTVSYKGLRVPCPKIFKTWSECSSFFSPDLLTALTETRGFSTTPCAIDMASVPLALQQRDVLCSGVTEFAIKARLLLVPLLMHVLRLPRMPFRSLPRLETSTSRRLRGPGPYAVIVVPDDDRVRALEALIGQFFGILKIRCFGLHLPLPIPMGGFPIIAATQVRLWFYLRRGIVTLEQCSFVALYDVEDIFESGRRPGYLDNILEAMPSHNLKPDSPDEELSVGRVYRSTYMISSTVTPRVQHLADKFLTSPVEMTLGQVLP